MSDHSDIAWTDATWNPVHGCTRVSEGCNHCYAEVRAARFSGEGLPFHGLARFVGTEGRREARWSGDVRLVPEALGLPRRWRNPRLVFVCSMSDLFHDSVPNDYIRQVFDVMAQTPQHRFQVLTKRSVRLRTMAPVLQWPSNVWAGVTVESAARLDRVTDLRSVPASVRFLSLEPLLGPLPGLSLEGINWVIVGGESGARFRPMQPEWVRDIRDACIGAGVPFFFKQWGGRTPKAGGRVVDSRVWDEIPIA